MSFKSNREVLAEVLQQKEEIKEIHTRYPDKENILGKADFEEDRPRMKVDEAFNKIGFGYFQLLSIVVFSLIRSYG